MHAITGKDQENEGQEVCMMSSDTKTTTVETKPEVKSPPPKPVAKKPEPEPVELPAFEKSISDKIVEKFGDKVEVAFVKEDRVRINVGRENVHDVAEFVRDGLRYDHVESVSGVDFPQDNEIEVVYHIGSYSDSSLARQILVLATRAQRETNPIPGNDATRLPTLRDVFYSVEFHEREIFEMFGVFFEGHPDNRRLLLPEDWADLPPLRKDFAIKGR
jgi:NADH:ubiquinone oxidoreductase subunit C